MYSIYVSSELVAIMYYPLFLNHLMTCQIWDAVVGWIVGSSSSPGPFLYILAIILLWMQCVFLPLDFRFGFVTCFDVRMYNSSKSLECVCMIQSVYTHAFLQHHEDNMPT